jgi:hypothetical protein
MPHPPPLARLLAALMLLPPHACAKSPTQIATSEPTTFAVLFDRSKDSPASPGFNQAVNAYVSDRASAVPGSVIELHLLGTDLGSTRLLGTFRFAGSKRTGATAVANARRKFREDYMAAAQQLLDEAQPNSPPTASPIAAGIAKVARRLKGLDNAVLIVASDLRESVAGRYDAECGPLDEALFQRYLLRNAYLTAGSLDGIQVEAYGVDASPIDGNRCVVTLPRQEQLESNWRNALLAASAERVLIGASVPPTALKGPL